MTATRTTARDRRLAAEAATREQIETDTEARVQAVLSAANQKRKPSTPARTPGEFAYQKGRTYISVNVGSDTVTITDVWIPTAGEEVHRPRAVLTRAQWDAIAPTIAGELNRQLKADGQAQGSFSREGETRLTATSLGKEALLLAWVVETIDATDPRMSLARSGWLRLHPVERWWLYNQCYPVNGTLADRGRGWRAGIRECLTATPIHN